MAHRYSVQGQVVRVLSVEENPDRDGEDECIVTVELSVETQYMADGLRFMAEDGQRFILATD